MMKRDKFIIRKIRFIFADGTQNNVHTRKEVLNVNSYREYLMSQYGAAKVDFVYDMIPADKCGQIRVKIA